MSATQGQRRLEPVRRVVTGLNAEGRSTVVSDEIAPFGWAFPNIPDYGGTDIWRTQVPADNSDSAEPCYTPFPLEPSPGGVVFRIAQFPPDKWFLSSFDADEAFGAMEGSEHVTNDNVQGNGTMHRTTTVDLAVVLSGEVYAVLEDGEVRLGVGDTFVQRGTVHGWSNRTDEVCRVAIILVDAGLDAAASGKGH
jgi:mannose-6-phosphate isomerase-like protein (cupin superfamily)